MTGFWSGRRVLVTGHTGFKGAWLTLWLAEQGAAVTGVALEPATEPALFTQLGLAERIDHRIADIRDRAGLARIVAEAQPQVVFHMAAQALVLDSYREPSGTWDTNVTGTVNLLEALRTLPGQDGPVAVVVVTTDKVYENPEDGRPFSEDAPLGGHDPYSASKAACEIAVSSWRRAFFRAGGADRIRIATARAGNVVGGGDWAENRLLPDLARAFAEGAVLKVRNPQAVRPWQHVLDPLAGYMTLAEALATSADPAFQDAFNFGPDGAAARPVAQVLEAACAHWPGRWVAETPPDAPHEAGVLTLATDRARDRLGWRPRWDFARTIRETVTWYRDAARADAEAIRALSLQTLADFAATAPAPAGVLP